MWCAPTQGPVGSGSRHGDGITCSGVARARPASHRTPPLGPPYRRQPTGSPVLRRSGRVLVDEGGQRCGAGVGVLDVWQMSRSREGTHLHRWRLLGEFGDDRCVLGWTVISEREENRTRQPAAAIRSATSASVRMSVSIVGATAGSGAATEDDTRLWDHVEIIDTTSPPVGIARDPQRIVSRSVRPSLGRRTTWLRVVWWWDIRKPPAGGLHGYGRGSGQAPVEGQQPCAERAPVPAGRPGEAEPTARVGNVSVVAGIRSRWRWCTVWPGARPTLTPRFQPSGALPVLEHLLDLLGESQQRTLLRFGTTRARTSLTGRRSRIAKARSFDASHAVVVNLVQGIRARARCQTNVGSHRLTSP